MEEPEKLPELPELPEPEEAEADGAGADAGADAEMMAGVTVAVAEAEAAATESTDAAVDAVATGELPPTWTTTVVWTTTSSLLCMWCRWPRGEATAELAIQARAMALATLWNNIVNEWQGTGFGWSCLCVVVVSETSVLGWKRR